MENQSRKVRMQKLIEQWQQSGKSQKAFTTDNNINYHTFRYWIEKFNSQENTSEFIQLNKSSVTGANICLRYPNGIELLLPAQIPLNLLKGLLRLS